MDTIQNGIGNNIISIFNITLPYLALVLSIIAIWFTSKSYSLANRVHKISLLPKIQFIPSIRNMHPDEKLKTFSISVIMQNTGLGIAVIKEFKSYVNNIEVDWKDELKWRNYFDMIGLKGDYELNCDTVPLGSFLKDGEVIKLLNINTIKSDGYTGGELKEILRTINFYVKYESLDGRKFESKT